MSRTPGGDHGLGRRNRRNPVVRHQTVRTNHAKPLKSVSGNLLKQEAVAYRKAGCHLNLHDPRALARMEVDENVFG